VDLKTARLYYEDPYQTEFQARVLERAEGGLCLYLDRTLFYPESGGQPCDRGWINGTPVREVLEDGERIAHWMEHPVQAELVSGRVAWERRFDHMQQHTGQHLLSAVLLGLYGAQTVGFHIGAEVTSIDLRLASLSPEQAARAEAQANELIYKNLPVRTHWEEAAAEGLRRATAREGPLRIVTIEGVDRTACGGTHVRATGEVGVILIRRLDRAHGGVRVEFVSGERARRRARADYEALSEIARALSAPLEQTPRLVAEQIKAWEASERARRKLALELAERRGRELYDATVPDSTGVRCAFHRLGAGTVDEELRALAQSFARQPGAVFLAAIRQPPSLLLAVSADSGLNAGAVVKEALGQVGGRGGGNPRMAQGGAPSPEDLEAALEQMARLIPALASGLASR